MLTLSTSAAFEFHTAPNLVLNFAQSFGEEMMDGNVDSVPEDLAG